MNSILFSPDMAVAYRKGLEGQTRRVKRSSKCQYGEIGDRVVLRSTWATVAQYDHLRPINLPTDAKIWSFFESDKKPEYFGRLRPGMFLPKHLWINMPRPRIVNIREESIQDITVEDAIAEGIFETPRDPGFACWSTFGMRDYYNTPREAFRAIWDSINAKRAPWASNPRVWVIEFEPMAHLQRRKTQTSSTRPFAVG